MKQPVVLLAMMAIVLTGCQISEKKLEVKKNPAYQVTPKWEITTNYPLFSSQDQAVMQSCKVLNKAIQSKITQLKDSIQREANTFFQTRPTSASDRPEWKYELIVQDSIFMANERFVSLRLEVYTYTGGAHGMTYFLAFNYDVQQKKLLTKEELLPPKDIARVNTLLKKYFQNPEQCFSADPTWQLTSCVNFNDSVYCLTYEQYTLGAYACGYAQVNIPRKELK